MHLIVGEVLFLVENIYAISTVDRFPLTSGTFVKRSEKYIIIIIIVNETTHWYTMYNTKCI